MSLHSSRLSTRSRHDTTRYDTHPHEKTKQQNGRGSVRGERLGKRSVHWPAKSPTTPTEPVAHCPLPIAPSPPPTKMGSTPVPLVSYSDVQAAHKRIAPYAHYTPLLTSQSIDAIATAALASSLPVRLAFKAEHLQRIGAFKFRGATNAVLSQLDAAKHDFISSGNSEHDWSPAKLVVVTHSSGNHAGALACAAKAAGAIAAVVMPESKSYISFHTHSTSASRVNSPWPRPLSTSAALQMRPPQRLMPCAATVPRSPSAFRLKRRASRPLRLS